MEQSPLTQEVNPGNQVEGARKWIQAARNFHQATMEPSSWKREVNLSNQKPSLDNHGPSPADQEPNPRYSSYKLQVKVFKLFLNFPLNGLHKTTFEIFETLKIEILMIFSFVFLNMGPYGSQKIQGTTPHTNHSRKFLNFSWMMFLMVLTKLCLDFYKFWNWNFFAWL